jgi:DNA-binding IclR family transcriptional regulator
MRTGARAALLAALAAQHGQLVTVRDLARQTRYTPGTVRDAAHLAESLGLVSSCPLPGVYPPLTGWVITARGRDFITPG